MFHLMKAIKEKNLIKIWVEERKNPYIYDITTGFIFLGSMRRSREQFPEIDFKVSTDNPWNMEKLLCRAVRGAIRFNDTSSVEFCDLFYNYPELIDPFQVHEVTECPKGYIPWLKENQKLITEQTLEEFKDYLIIKNFSKAEKEVISFYEGIDNNISHAYSASLKWIFTNQFTETQRKIYAKILSVSLKTWSFDFNQDLLDFANWTDERRKESNNYLDNWENVVDTNRNFNYNIKLMKTIKDKEKEEKIASRQQIIKEIEKLSNDTLKVIVPTTLKEFTEEGKMQNNCVGHYYHDSIIRGENFIYFIRKTETPNKSYITNRYNIDYKTTTESRAKNNDGYTDETVIDLIKQIDEVIYQILN